MILYHGSDIDINEIDLSYCKPNKDFGRGFYLTERVEDAQNMALQRSVRSGNPAVVNVYEFDENVLNDPSFRVKTFDRYSLEWAEFVFKNRRGDSGEEYDIVYGPIADDRIGAQIARYAEGYLTAQEFLNRIKYMKGVSYQYYFGTNRSIALLTKLLQ